MATEFGILLLGSLILDLKLLIRFIKSPQTVTPKQKQGFRRTDRELYRTNRTPGVGVAALSFLHTGIVRTGSGTSCSMRMQRVHTYRVQVPVDYVSYRTVWTMDQLPWYIVLVRMHRHKE